jgi:hypothetical protein
MVPGKEPFSTVITRSPVFRFWDGFHRHYSTFRAGSRGPGGLVATLPQTVAALLSIEARSESLLNLARDCGSRCSAKRLPRLSPICSAPPSKVGGWIAGAVFTTVLFVGLVILVAAVQGSAMPAFGGLLIGAIFSVMMGWWGPWTILLGALMMALIVVKPVVKPFGNGS